MTHTTKHTPGPWNVTHGSIIPRVYGPDDNLIAEIHPQRRRDAHIIAAAPAMYAALMSIVGLLDGRHAEIVSTALAQAEGRTL